MNQRVLIAFVLAAVFTASGCAKILGLEQDDSGPFEHRAHVLEGINCLKCHADMSEMGDTDPVSFPSNASCLECHAQPHDPSPCNDCHGRASIRYGAQMARKHLVFSHADHTKIEGSDQCVRCHVDVKYEAHSLRPSMANCFSCHEHSSEWDYQDCSACHVDLVSEGTLPQSHLVHEGDWLREHGVRAASARDLCMSCHTERQCASCHGISVPEIPSRFRFDDPTRNSMHRAGFISRHDMEARADPALCLSCHTDNSCVECHDRNGVSALASATGNPHPPGWSGPPGSGNAHGRAARLDPLSCASCHGGAGEMLCVGCHRVGGPGGSPHPPGFSSRLDKRSDRPCRFCHTGAP